MAKNTQTPYKACQGMLPQKGICLKIQPITRANIFKNSVENTLCAISRAKFLLMRTILIMIHSKYYYRSVVTQGIHPLQFIWLWFMVFLLIYLEILSLFSWIFAMLFCGHCFCVFQLFSCYKSCIHSCSLPVSYEPVSYKKTCTSALMLGW